MMISKEFFRLDKIEDLKLVNIN